VAPERLSVADYALAPLTRGSHLPAEGACGHFGYYRSDDEVGFVALPNAYRERPDRDAADALPRPYVQPGWGAR